MKNETGKGGKTGYVQVIRYIAVKLFKNRGYPQILEFSHSPMCQGSCRLNQSEEYEKEGKCK